MRPKQKFTKTNTSVRLDPRIREKLDKIAERKKRRPTELIRLIVENYVEQFENF